MPPTAPHPSVLTVLDEIKQYHPDVPFLALGQTVFWDEPDKAVWRRLLDDHLPGSALIAGVHDTDYFAKTSAHVGDAQKFVALPHNDGPTRDLWSAAGEMSSLFGSESVPTRSVYLKHGVPFDWLAKAYPGGRAALFADKTEAWGWRGIVHTESHNVIAHDIPIRDIQDALLEQMDWAFRESLLCLADAGTRDRAATVAATVKGWVLEFLETCSGDSCRLSDLYQTLLPRFYRLLLGAPAADLSLTSSITLFQFNRQTYEKPRFSLVGLFLDPKTRRIARESYDRAVGGSGSGIYTLDAFGPGAIPFDLVIPGVGRGTIRTAPAALVIETATQDTFVPLCEPITRLDQLAAIVEDQFGPDAALVGKAVTLADMIAAEHLVVFHETASGYTKLTQAMNARMAGRGVPLALHPIVRLTYPTWDALAAVPETVTFRLPAHLATTFGTETISAPDFANRWHAVLADCRQTLRESREIRGTRALLCYLESKRGSGWCGRQAEYESALMTLKEIADHSDTLRGRMEEHAQELGVWRKERADLERRMGEDFRHSLQPLLAKRAAAVDPREAAHFQAEISRQSAVRARAFVEPIEVARERIAATRGLIASFRRERRLLERGPEAREARVRLREVTLSAESARLDLVHDAYLTMESLEHTQLRPTAWWLPLVDGSGAWFAAMVAGTEARLEELA